MRTRTPDVAASPPRRPNLLSAWAFQTRLYIRTARKYRQLTTRDGAHGVSSWQEYLDNYVTYECPEGSHLALRGPISAEMEWGCQSETPIVGTCPFSQSIFKDKTVKLSHLCSYAVEDKTNICRETCENYHKKRIENWREAKKTMCGDGSFLVPINGGICMSRHDFADTSTILLSHGSAGLLAYGGGAAFALLAIAFFAGLRFGGRARKDATKQR